MYSFLFVTLPCFGRLTVTGPYFSISAHRRHVEDTAAHSTAFIMTDRQEMEKHQIKKSSYYVWFLGAKESRGLRGEEFISPVVKHLIGKELQQTPIKVTLQLSNKGLKIIQNVSGKRLHDTYRVSTLHYITIQYSTVYSTGSVESVSHHHSRLPTVCTCAISRLTSHIEIHKNSKCSKTFK